MEMIRRLFVHSHGASYWRSVVCVILKAYNPVVAVPTEALGT